MALSKRIRYEVLKRDNHTCRYCHATDSPLTVDHVTPVALGGSDAPDNLVAACKDCNAGKSSTSPTGPLVEDVKQLDLAWAEAIKRAARLRSEARRKELAYLRAFEDEWNAYGYQRSYSADPDSVTRLYRAGLPKADMVAAISIAMTQRGVNDRFAYFMGICWKILTDLQETAKQLLAADEVAQ